MPESTNKRVVVALSGKLDSAIAAYLLISQGYHVTALHMTHFQEELEENEVSPAIAKCINKRANVEKICSKLGMDVEYVDVGKEFAAYVTDTMKHEYLKAREPQPCFLCNRHIKFGVLFNHAINKMKADFFATGHCARVYPEHGDKPRVHLFRGIDHDYEQSYHLYDLDQEVLKKVLFPLGEIKRKNILEFKYRFEIGDIPESKPNARTCTEIFLKSDTPDKILLKKTSERFKKNGVLQKLDGDIIRHYHDGIFNYRIGKEFKLGKDTFYVISKNLKTGVIVVDEKKYLSRKRFTVSNLIWMTDEQTMLPALTLDAKISETHPPAKARVLLYEDRTGLVVFDEKQPSIVPGHRVVFYKGPQVFGGGTIDVVI